MTSAAEEFRPIGLDDESALATFPCRGYRQPWSDVVEELVQEHLLEAVLAGHVEAMGLWDADELVGVIAWRFEATSGGAVILRSVLLASRFGRRRRGLGRRLKQRLIDEARTAGADAVVSHVHWDNDAMLELNRSLGANIERDPTDREHAICVVAVSR